MSQYVIHSIDLSQLEWSESVKFLEAQWWDDRSPLVVVAFRHEGHLTKLRMDLDKMTFIDHVLDARTDETIQNFAGPIWEIIVRERFGTPSLAEERAHEI